ncbi:MAG: PadR family transcriptional regulator [Bryobacterales bacterium]|nr:PadR family transcriptional regulator [Bryobacterales bacterium]
MTKLNLLQGTLDLIVLRALAEQPLHGYAIAQHIREVSEQRLLIEEGSLYPALYRMEKKGWIGSRWDTTDKGRRARVYSLTAAGCEQLAAERANWEALTDVMARILGQGE